MSGFEQKLSEKKCQPCEGQQQPMPRALVMDHLNSLMEWGVTEDEKKIYREYHLKNFIECVDFINKVAQIAESEDHHPDLHLTDYKKLKIELSTHAIGGLSENDFIVAAKINQLN
jgi:4a-hydroxytetrahydrobiopterin dehydratase